jgi:rRNA small subunit pseudouridine methyltransferase Nep1
MNGATTDKTSYGDRRLIRRQSPVSLVIAESALETVPREIAGHSSVKNHAQRLGKKPTEILLDRSYHHAAMKSLKSNWKRGRPDLVHFALAEALATPLFLRGMLKVYVHTADDKVIIVGDNLRIPKAYFRFEGLIMDLYKKKTVTSSEGQMLLELQDNVSFEALVKRIIRPGILVGLSTVGFPATVDQVVKKNIDAAPCTFVIGGFPRGHFSDRVTSLLQATYSIGEQSMEAHVVIARIVYECERALHCT